MAPRKGLRFQVEKRDRGRWCSHMEGFMTAPTEADATAAWERYALLIRQVVDNPMIFNDRKFNEACILAHEEFKALFLAMRP